MRRVHSELNNKGNKKKVDKVIDSILKESSMTRKEFDEIKGIEMEMKANAHTKVLEVTPIALVGPLEGVIIAQPCAQTLIAPYAAVAPMQPIKSRYEFNRNIYQP